MLKFMDYVVDAFNDASNWSRNNSYSSLTATSDALLSFSTPTTLSLNVSSLSTPHFATSYSLSTLGVIDGSVSYLYSSVPLNGIPSATPSIPLKSLVRGYRDLHLPFIPPKNQILADGERKPTLLYGTLALPPPSALSAFYARRINPRTLFSLSLHSKSVNAPTTGSSPPPASVLAHLQHDTGRYSVEALASTDSALIGMRGLWNFGLPSEPTSEGAPLDDTGNDFLNGLSDVQIPRKPPGHRFTVSPKPSLLSAGAEMYYSPLSSVIGLSTGLRFTTLPSAIPSSPSSSSNAKPLAGTSAALSSAAANALSSPPASSFPYTMTLTLTPLTGSLASTYSIKPTGKLALSSRFCFNVYSWESEYVLGAEIWRKSHRGSQNTSPTSDGLDWAREKAARWLDDAQKTLTLNQAAAAEAEEALRSTDESVINLRVDDNWRFRALWTGRIKELLVSAGINLSAPTSAAHHHRHHHHHHHLHTNGPGGAVSGPGLEKKWKGSVGVEVSYSS